MYKQKIAHITYKAHDNMGEYKILHRGQLIEAVKRTWGKEAMTALPVLAADATERLIDLKKAKLGDMRFTIIPTELFESLTGSRKL